MKNIYELLEQTGVQIPAEKKDEFEKAFSQNYKTSAEAQKLREARDELKGQLAKAQSALESLKKDAGDAEQLRAAIEAHEKTILQMRQDAEAKARTGALRDALRDAGITDPDYVIWKQGGIETFEFDGETPQGVDTLVKTLREDAAMGHLFGKQQPDGYQPQGGSKPNGRNPFAKDTFNLTEQGRMLTEHPEQARALAGAAGLKI